MNKKLIFACAAFIIGFSAEAQIEKGKILAGGSVGLSTSKYREVLDGSTLSENNSTYLWFSPRVGYFITDAIAVGAGLSLYTGTTKYDNDNKFNSSSIAFTPFVRYYLPQGFFGQFEFGPGSETDKWKLANGNDTKDKYKSFLWSLGVGYAFFLNDHVAVEPMLSYTATTYTESDNTNFKDRYGTLLFQIGFNLYLDMP